MSTFLKTIDFNVLKELVLNRMHVTRLVSLQILFVATLVLKKHLHVLGSKIPNEHFSGLLELKSGARDWKSRIQRNREGQ